MNSDDSLFNVLLIVRDKEEKGEAKPIRTEDPMLTSLTPYHKARPAHTLLFSRALSFYPCESSLLTVTPLNFGHCFKSVLGNNI